LNAQFTVAGLEGEARFIADPSNRNRERPYGWGWAPQLIHDVPSWRDPDAQRWARHFEPLAETLSSNFLDWLPRSTLDASLSSSFGLSPQCVGLDAEDLGELTCRTQGHGIPGLRVDDGAFGEISGSGEVGLREGFLDPKAFQIGERHPLRHHVERSIHTAIIRHVATILREVCYTPRIGNGWTGRR
jgi:hypothetical protein